VALNQLGLGLLFTAKDAASGVMRQIRNGFSQTRDEVGRFGSRATEAFDDLGRGGKAFAVGMAGLGALALTVPSAAAFGEKIAEITTLTDEASLNSGYLSDEVMRLNAAYGGGTAKQAKAMYDGISAGASNATQATALLESSNKLAIAGVTDVGTALDGLTSSLNAYGRSFEDAGEFSDYFITAVKQGKTTIPELSAVIGRVAPTAAAMNVSMQEVSASLATITAKGLKTEEAATGLKAALANIIKPTADATAEAKRLGVDFSAAAVRSKGFAGLLKDVTSSAKFNDDSLAALFGSVEGLNTVLALTAGGGEKFAANLKGMEGAAGAADAAFKKMERGLAHQAKRFAGVTENAKIMIGQALEPIAAAVLRVVSTIVEGFTKIPKPIRDFAVRAAAAAAAVTALTGAVTAGIAALRIAGAAMRTFGIATSSGMLSAFGPALLVIGAVAAAVAAFKYAIDRNIGGLGDKFDAAKSWITGFFVSIGQLVETGHLDEDMSAAFLGGEDSAVQFAVKVFQVLERVMEFFEGVGRGFGKGLEAAQPVFDAFGAALDRLGEAFDKVVGPARDASAEFDAAGSAGESVGSGLAKGIEVVVAILTVLTDVATGVVSMWDTISESLDAVGEAFGAVGDAIGEVMAVFGDASAEAGGATSGWQALGQVLGGVVAVALQVVASLIRSVADQIGNLAVMFSGVVDIIAGIASGDWPRVWNGMKKVVFGFVQGVIDFLLGMVQVVADTIDKIAQAVGKESTLGKDLRAWRDEQKASLKEFMGIEEYAAAPKAPAPGVMANAPLPGAAPAVAAIAPGGAPMVDSGAVAAAAARGAMAGLPATQINANLIVDGEALGRLVVKANASEASRSGATAAVDVG
jgi:TP901 family phage tail tape measure protein